MGVVIYIMQPHPPALGLGGGEAYKEPCSLAGGDADEEAGDKA